MIKQEQKSLETFIQEASKQAKQKQEGQLVCMTEKINHVDFIYIFEAATQRNQERFFWANPTQDFMMVGIGKAAEMKAEQNRFTYVKEKWQELQDHAFIYNPYEEEGTGLVTFGGMSFDPKKEQTKLWDKFAPIHLIIANYTIIKSKNEYFLTITKRIKPDEDAEVVFEKVQHAKERILNETIQLPKPPIIKSQAVIESEQWLEKVRLAIQAIKQEQANKIVMARELRLRFEKQAEISPVLQELLTIHKGSYIFAFTQGDDCFVGATPERLIQVRRRELLSTCLAGTAPRGKTEAIDQEMVDYLLRDDKNLTEHLYVVQMIRHRLEKYCENLDIPKKPIVHTLKDLHHLYTPVSAQMKDGVSVFDIIKSLHPTPALGGAPKETALTFIREHEPLDRGWYGAPIGWLDHQENGEFAVAIRSSLFQGDKASLFAGCGVMGDSDPQVEYEETMIKFLPMLSVLEGFADGSH